MPITSNNITGTLVPAGQTIFGPFSTSFATCTVTLNLTGSGNHPWLAKVATDTVLAVSIESSPDGGITWNFQAGATLPGLLGVTLLRTTFELEVTNSTDAAAIMLRGVTNVTAPPSDPSFTGIFISGKIATT